MKRCAHPLPAITALVLSMGSIWSIWGPLMAAGRDTAFYPVSGRSTIPVPTPPVLFNKQCELTLPGLPSGGSLTVSADGGSATVRTSAGRFRVDTSKCEVQSESLAPTNGQEPGSGEGSSSTSSISMRGVDRPAWRRRLRGTNLDGLGLPGPDDLVALLARDGTIYGRHGRSGHLLWRRLASHRISRSGASMGDYLIVAADASRALEAFRWTDGTPAGIFQLDSEDALFASEPVAGAGRILVLAVQSPRLETRLLALSPRPAGVGAEPPPAGSLPAPRR